MAERRAWPSALKWALRLVLAGVIVLIGFAAWYVLVPASRVTSVFAEGIPLDSTPRLTATSISDLPMQCTSIAQGGALNERGRPPHRNHVYLARHQGLYIAMFSYWYGAEGQPGQAVRYSVSSDGQDWSAPRPLADPAPGQGIIARGFVERDGKLFAWYAAHTGDTFFRNGKQFPDPAQFEAERNIAILESEWLGEEQGWRFSRVVLEGYLNNYAPRRFGERLIMAVRDQDRETYLATSDDDGQTWSIGSAMPVPATPTMGEPGLYLPDEPVVTASNETMTSVLLRNNNTADGRLWAVQLENGEWQEPYPLDFPADASKFVPLELASGEQAMVGNFEPEVHRALMHLAVSDDGGETYDTLYRLAPDNQYAGFAWRSPQYPHTLVDEDQLLIAFTFAKREIAVCSAASTEEGLAQQAGFALTARLFDGLCNKNMPQVFRRAAGYAGCREHFVWG